jgi:hypothetical protein
VDNYLDAINYGFLPVPVVVFSEYFNNLYRYLKLPLLTESNVETAGAFLSCSFFVNLGEERPEAERIAQSSSRGGIPSTSS